MASKYSTNSSAYYRRLLLVVALYIVNYTGSAAVAVWILGVKSINSVYCEPPQAIETFFFGHCLQIL